jgi:hypothetical protein
MLVLVEDAAKPVPPTHIEVRDPLELPQRVQQVALVPDERAV